MISAAVADRRATAAASWADRQRFLMPQRFMVTTCSTNLTRDGKPVGQRELVSDNPGFAALICLMLLSMVAAFFGLAWLATPCSCVDWVAGARRYQGARSGQRFSAQVAAGRLRR